MSHSPRNRWMKYLHTPVVTFSITAIGLVLCCVGLLLLAKFNSSVALASMQKGDFTTAKVYANKSLPIVTGFNTITLGLVPDLVVWKESLTLPIKIESLVHTVISFSENSFQSDTPASVTTLLPDITALHSSLQTVSEKIPHTIIIKKYIPQTIVEKLPTAVAGLNSAETVINSLSQGKQTWVVLLQNSDELRATGGFPGSYVLLNFDNGVLAEIVVEDIYDADGQFKGFVTAPAGIKEYTSGNNGLRLPDANWWPDFPKSAQTMLQFFALGDKNNIAGVVAINLDTAKSILKVTGPLWLPDYKIEVNQENIGEVLRAERSEFFPGSSQKKHLLNLTLIQLKQKISQLSTDQQQQLFSEIKRKISEKELQIFSTQPDLQEIFSEYHLSGELNDTALLTTSSLNDCNCKPVTIAFVESNVGINKVNKYVVRSNELVFTAKELQITTTFTNNSSPLSSTELSDLIDQPTETVPRNGNGYLNYYRLLISPEYSVSAIQVGGIPVTTWDEERITTTSGTELKQIGILSAVTEKTNNTVTFSLTTDRETIPEALVLFKQSGVPASTYTLKTPSKSQEFDLQSDQVLALQ